MQDQRIEKVITVAINIIKVLVIIYLGFVEVFKIGKLLRDKLDLELDSSRKWATQNYSILKKRLEEQKLAGVWNFLLKINWGQTSSAHSTFAARHRLIQYSLRVDLITLSVVGISGGVSCFKQVVDLILG